MNNLMSSWTKQQGYPVVTVKVKDEKLEFEQVFSVGFCLLLVLSFFRTFKAFIPYGG